MTLLDQITDSFGAAGALSSIASALGTSEDDAQSLLGHGLPTILTRLGQHATDDESAGALHSVAKTDGGGLLERMGSVFGDDHSGAGSGLIGTIFGSRRGAAEEGLATATGLDLSTVSRFLPMVAPGLISLIGKVIKDDNVEAGALAALMVDDAVRADVIEDDDRSTFIAGLTGLGESGGLAAIGGVAAGTGAAAGLVTHDAGAAAASADSDSADYDYEPNRKGMGWLLPALVVFGGLILGLILWQCADTGSDAITIASAPADVDEPAELAPEPEPEPEPTAEPATEPEPAPEPEPEPQPEPEPEAAPAAPTIAELAAGNADLSTLVSLATDAGLASTLADPDAGPFTVFAPTNDAFDSAGDVLGRLDGDQVETTLGFHVVPGLVSAVDVVPGAEFETLAGETLVIGSDGTLPGGVAVTTADLEASNGIVHIVESVLVPNSIQRSLATSDINELFVLDPIQFAVSSAEILPESIPTLDRAVEFLINVPAGSQFEVQGHTDSDGAEEPNQLLSEARAASVVAYLTSNGVDPALLVPVGYGETQLKIDPDLTPEDKALNRRIEFVDISS